MFEELSQQIARNLVTSEYARVGWKKFSIYKKIWEFHGVRCELKSLKCMRPTWAQKQETIASDPSSSENACATVSVNDYKANFSTYTTAANWGPVASHNTVSLKGFEANFSTITGTDGLIEGLLAIINPQVEKLGTVSL